MKRRSWVIGSILVAFLGVAVGVVWVGVVAVRAVLPPAVTTNPDRYNEILKEWQPSGLVSHFPAALPVGAREVRLSHFPGFLQGGAHFQIRVRLSAEEAGQILDEYSKIATHQFDGGHKNVHANMEGAVPTTFFYTGESDAVEFPSSCTVLVLGANDFSGGTWNHGKSYGVAVDVQSGDIVYWAEYW